MLNSTTKWQTGKLVNFLGASSRRRIGGSVLVLCLGNPKLMACQSDRPPCHHATMPPVHHGIANRQPPTANRQQPRVWPFDACVGPLQFWLISAAAWRPLTTESSATSCLCVNFRFLLASVCWLQESNQSGAA